MSRRHAACLTAVAATLIVSVICLAQPAGPAAGPRVSFEDDAWMMRDIEYGRADGLPLHLDFHSPADDATHPAVVWIHGGGWRNGDKAGGLRAVQGEKLLADGIAVFSINYRLSGIAPYPAAVDDCLRAVRWIRANAADLGIDPDRMAVWGASAGAHLALMMGFLEPGPEDVGADGEQIDNFFRCVLDKNGPTDLDAEGMYGEPALMAFMATSPGEDPERFVQASPITHVSADDPPVLLMHGTEDRTVPYSQSVALAQRLAEVGVEHELLTVEGAGHGLRGGDREEIAAVHQRAYEFVRTHLLGE